MAGQIASPESGKRTNQLWRIVKDCVTALNLWNNAKVVINAAGTAAAPSGEFKIGDGNVVLDLKLNGILPPLPGTGTFVLGSVDNVLQWLATDTCS